MRYPRSLSLLVFLLLIGLTACTGSGGGARAAAAGDALTDLVGVDLVALDKVDYQRAVKRIARVLEHRYPVLDDPLVPREAGPRAIWALADESVLVIDGDAGSWGLSRVDAGGGLLWREELQLGQAVDLVNWQLSSPRALRAPALQLEVSGGGQVAQLTWALGEEALLLVRVANAAGRLVPAALAEEHPALQPGGAGERLHGVAVPLTLQRLIALAQPGAARLRQEAEVRSGLQELSGSTNAWVAETAAYVAILP